MLWNLRRCVSVELTERGRTLLAEKQHLVADRRRAFHDSLAAGERDWAADLLERLAAVIDEL